MPEVNSVYGWEKWILRAILGAIGVAALGVWNDVHDMKSDLRSHIAKEDQVNANEDYRLDQQAEVVAKNREDLSDIKGRVKVTEWKLGIH
jgi:hypothetical protein